MHKITTTELVITGPDGTAQVRIAGTDDGPRFTLLDAHGRPRIVAQVDADSAGLELLSASGHRRAALGTVNNAREGERTTLGVYGADLDAPDGVNPDPLVSLTAGEDWCALGLDDIAIGRDAEGDVCGARPRLRFVAGRMLRGVKGGHVVIFDDRHRPLLELPESARPIGARLAREWAPPIDEAPEEDGDGLRVATAS